MGRVIEAIDENIRAEQFQLAADLAHSFNTATQLHEIGQALTTALDPEITRQIREIDHHPDRTGPVILNAAWGTMIGNGLLDFSGNNKRKACRALEIWEASIGPFAEQAEINHGLKQFIIGSMRSLFKQEPARTKRTNTMRSHVAAKADGIAASLYIKPYVEPPRIVRVNALAMVK